MIFHLQSSKPDSPSIFFSLHPQTHQKKHVHAHSCFPRHTDVRRRPNHWLTLWVCFLSQTSFIDLLRKRFYSGQIWKTKLYNNLNFCLLLLIVESPKGGSSCWNLESWFLINVLWKLPHPNLQEKPPGQSKWHSCLCWKMVFKFEKSHRMLTSQIKLGIWWIVTPLVIAQEQQLEKKTFCGLKS